MFIECESRVDVLELHIARGDVHAVLLVGLDASELCRLTKIQSLRKKMHFVTAHQMIKKECAVDELIQLYTASKNECEALALELKKRNAATVDPSNDESSVCSNQIEQDKSQAQSDNTDADSVSSLKASFNLTQKPKR